MQKFANRPKVIAFLHWVAVAFIQMAIIALAVAIILSCVMVAWWMLRGGAVFSL